MKPSAPLKVYVQKAHAFGLPADPATPIIMIGPGTGVAPFRAFLHERMATKAKGRNWLFFGHQRLGQRLLLRGRVRRHEGDGRAHAAVARMVARRRRRNSTCRTACAKSAATCGRGSTDGAHVYVCGDAKRMAKDVERALVDIVAQHGARSTDEAIAFVADLKKRGRYQQDVY